jgi:hypothetical protein
MVSAAGLPSMSVTQLRAPGRACLDPCGEPLGLRLGLGLALGGERQQCLVAGGFRGLRGHDPGERTLLRAQAESAKVLEEVITPFADCALPVERPPYCAVKGSSFSTRFSAVTEKVRHWW